MIDMSISKGHKGPKHNGRETITRQPGFVSRRQMGLIKQHNASQRSGCLAGLVAIASMVGSSGMLLMYIIISIVGPLLAR